MEDQLVQYSIKELLTSIDHKIDKLSEILEKKVDQSVFAAAASRLAEIEKHGTHQSQTMHESIVDVDRRLRLLEDGSISAKSILEYQENAKVNGARLKLMGWGLVVSIFASLTAFSFGIIELILRK